MPSIGKFATYVFQVIPQKLHGSQWSLIEDPSAVFSSVEGPHLILQSVPGTKSPTFRPSEYKIPDGVLVTALLWVYCRASTPGTLFLTINQQEDSLEVPTEWRWCSVLIDSQILTVWNVCDVEITFHHRSVEVPQFYVGQVLLTFAVSHSETPSFPLSSPPEPTQKYWYRARPLLISTRDTSELKYWHRGAPIGILPSTSQGVAVNPEVLTINTNLNTPSVAVGVAAFAYPSTLNIGLDLKIPRIDALASPVPTSATLGLPTPSLAYAYKAEQWWHEAAITQLPANVWGGGSVSVSPTQLVCELTTINPSIGAFSYAAVTPSPLNIELLYGTGYLYPVDTYGSQRQTGWVFMDPLQLTFSTTGAWVDKDVTLDFPPGTFMLLLQVQNTATNKDYKFSVRVNGSTENRSASTVYRGTTKWMIVPIPDNASNRIFEVYIENTAVRAYVTGYCRYFCSQENPISGSYTADKSLDTAGSYLTVNTRMWTASALFVKKQGAQAVLMEVYNSGASTYKYAVRPVGTTYDYYYGQYARASSLAIAKLDTNFDFQMKIENIAVDTFLYGWGCSDFKMFSSPQLMTITTTYNTWVDHNISNYVSPGHIPVGAILQVINPTAGTIGFNVRKNNSTTSITTAINLPAGCQHFIMVGVDSDNIFEVYVTASGIQMYLLGYITESSAICNTLGVPSTLQAPTVILPAVIPEGEGVWYFPRDALSIDTALAYMRSRYSYVPTGYAFYFHRLIVGATPSVSVLPDDCSALIVSAFGSTYLWESSGTAGWQPYETLYNFVSYRGSGYSLTQCIPLNANRVAEYYWSYSGQIWPGEVLIRINAYFRGPLHGFSTPYEKSNTTTGWQVRSASEVPNGTHAVSIFSMNYSLVGTTYYSSFPWHSSTYSPQVINLWPRCGQSFFTPIDSSKQFYQYCNSLTYAKSYLCAYANADHMRVFTGVPGDPYYLLTPQITGWNTFSVDGIVPDDAAGVLLYFTAVSGYLTVMVRTDADCAVRELACFSYPTGYQYAVGINYNKTFEIYAVPSSNYKIYLLGYFRGYRKVVRYCAPRPLQVAAYLPQPTKASTPIEVEWLSNQILGDPIEITSRITQGSWNEVEIGDLVPPSANGVFAAVVNTSIYHHYFGLCPAGLTFGPWEIRNSSAETCLIYVGTSSSKKIKAYVSDSTYVRIYILGWTNGCKLVSPIASVFVSKAFYNDSDINPDYASVYPLDYSSAVDIPQATFLGLYVEHTSTLRSSRTDYGLPWSVYTIDSNSNESRPQAPSSSAIIPSSGGLIYLTPTQHNAFNTSCYSTAITYNIHAYLENTHFVPLHNAVAITVPANVWVDVDVSPYVGADAVGVLVSSGAGGHWFRRNGNITYIGPAATPIVVGLDTDGVFETWSNSSNNHIVITGWFRGDPYLGSIKAFPETLDLSLTPVNPGIANVARIYADFKGIAFTPMPPPTIRYGLTHFPDVIVRNLQALDPAVALAATCTLTPNDLNLGLEDCEVFEGTFIQVLQTSLNPPEVCYGRTVSVDPISLTASLKEPDFFEFRAIVLEISTLAPTAGVFAHIIPTQQEVAASLIACNVYSKTTYVAPTLVLQSSTEQPQVADVNVGAGSLELTLTPKEFVIMSDVTVFPEQIQVQSQLETCNVAIVFPMDLISIDAELQLAIASTKAAVWFFPVNAIPLILLPWAVYSWSYYSLADTLPAETKGIIIHVRNLDTIPHIFAVRRRFSGVDRSAYARIAEGTHLWVVVGLDPFLRFDWYLSTADPTKLDARIVAYCTLNAFRDHDLDVSIETTGAYEEITIPEGALIPEAQGVFLELVQTGVSTIDSWAVREKGTTSDLYYRTQGPCCQMAVAALNDARQFEMKISSTSIDAYAWGALGHDCHLFSSPIEITVNPSSSWTDVDVSSIVPSDATGVILDLVNATNVAQKIHVRTKGSSDYNDLNALYVPAQTHIHAITGINNQKIFQVYSTQSSSYSIYLLGYILGGYRHASPLPQNLYLTPLDTEFSGSPSVTVSDLDLVYLSFYRAGITNAIDQTLDDVDLSPTIIALFDTVIAAFGFDNDALACEITYSFNSDIAVTETGIEVRHPTFSSPKREVVLSLGVVDAAVYDNLKRSLLTGARLTYVPLWQFSTNLLNSVMPGATQIEVEKSTDFYPGEHLLIIRQLDASAYDYVEIVSVIDQTITLAAELENEYHPDTMTNFVRDPLSSTVVPCVYGNIEVEAEDISGDASLFYAKLRVNAGAWSQVQLPETLPDFLYPPATAEYSEPHVERDLLGDSTGVLAFRSYEDSFRLTFTLEWHFSDDTWRILRDLFFYSKGRARTFYMPTWMTEMRVIEFTAQGSTSLKLNPAYYEMWARFSDLLIIPRYGNPFKATIIYMDAEGSAFLKSMLPANVYPGDPISLCPQVRFADDALTFTFYGKDKCIVKATFLETREGDIGDA
ncbi:MAG: hypothetical protein QXT73_00765 [Candidatus Methanomethylicaceae archaeon]